MPVNDGDDVAKLKVLQYHGPGNADGDPASYGAHTVITPTSVVFNPNFQLWEMKFPVTGFSGFFVSGQPEDALPVTLVAFNAQKRENDVNLTWRTSEETAAAYFEIQRSTDARSFIPVGRLNAKGDSRVIENYAFTDLNAALKGRHKLYYRLKMVDRAADGLDGSFSYSRVVSVDLGGGPDALTIYPNPLIRDRKLSIEMPGAQHISAELLDILGNNVTQQNQLSVSGVSGKFEMQLNNIPAGTYILKITADGTVSIRKVVIQ